MTRQRFLILENETETVNGITRTPTSGRAVLIDAIVDVDFGIDENGSPEIAISIDQGGDMGVSTLVENGATAERLWTEIVELGRVER